jgi:hypothetical protein
MRKLGLETFLGCRDLTAQINNQQPPVQTSSNEDFEQYLFEKYPSLFQAGENGKLPPLRYNNNCPKGWENIVDHLCGAFVDYTTYTSRTIKNPNRKFMHFVKDLMYKCNVNINTQKNPNNIFYKKVKQLIRLIQLLVYKQQLYIVTKPPVIKILQYKEKFGCLRMYISGGDETVEGMIKFAEYLSQKTCQCTGEPGSLVKIGSWSAVLSPEQAELRRLLRSSP